MEPWQLVECTTFPQPSNVSNSNTNRPNTPDSRQEVENQHITVVDQPSDMNHVASEFSFLNYVRTHFSRREFKVFKKQNKNIPMQKSGPDVTFVPDDNPTAFPLEKTKKVSVSDSMIHLRGRVLEAYQRIVEQNFSSSSSNSSTCLDSSSSEDSFYTTATTSQDMSCLSSASSTSEDELSPPEPPDGGWGWIIVIAAFFIQMIDDGVATSFGIFLDDLSEEFGASLSVTSWIGAFGYGIPCLAAPVASMLINKFQCRKVCVVGGLVSSIGCALAFFVQSMLGLVLTFGVLVGLGASLSSTAALIIVSLYFDDRRATATGLSIAGSGVGSFVFAPLVNFLINTYTWRGAMLILSGIFTNIIVCGCLMRPIETGGQRRKRQLLLRMENFAKESGFKLPKVYLQSKDEHIDRRIHLLRKLLTSPQRISSSDSSSESIVDPPFITSDALMEDAVNSQDAHCSSLTDNKNEDSAHLMHSLEPSSSSKPLVNALEINQILSVKPTSPCTGDLNAHETNKNFPQQRLQPLLSSTATSLRNALVLLPPVYGRTKRSIYHRSAAFQSSSEHQSRSVLSMPNLQSSALSLTSSSTSTSSNCLSEHARRFCKQVRRQLRTTVDPSMFWSLSFNMFLLSTLFLFFWCNVTYFFITIYANTQLGISNYLSAMLLAIMGGSDMVGEVAYGWAADQPWSNILYLYTSGVVICGISTMMVPLANSFGALVFYNLIFGFTMAANDSLCTIIVIEFLGLSRLVSGLGFCLFCQGASSIFGPPVIGFIIDSTQSYIVAFTVCGAGVVLAGLVMFPSIIRQYRRRLARHRRQKARRQKAVATADVVEAGDAQTHSSPPHFPPV